MITPRGSQRSCSRRCGSELIWIPEHIPECRTEPLGMRREEATEGDVEPLRPKIRVRVLVGFLGAEGVNEVIVLAVEANSSRSSGAVVLVERHWHFPSLTMLQSFNPAKKSVRLHPIIFVIVRTRGIEFLGVGFEDWFHRELRNQRDTWVKSVLGSEILTYSDVRTVWNLRSQRWSNTTK